MALLVGSAMALLIAAALVGVVIGIFSGLLGIGGGMVMVPVFRLVFGMSPIASTATSLFAIIPTSISGGIQRIRNHTCVVKLGIAMGIGGAITSSLGVALAQVVPGWAIMVTAAVVIGYSSFTSFKKALEKPSQQKAAAQEAAFEGQFTGRQYAVAVVIGAFAGLVSGFIGVGGGFIMVPLMASVLNMPMKLTSGTSLIAILLLATPASITQCMIGNVDYVAGIAMACGSIPGAILGSNLVKRLPERTLRFLFSGFLFIAAILLIVKEAGLMA